MKFGAVRDVNSLSALMIARDDHDSALSAAPKPRHHLQGFFKKIIEYQNDNEHSGMTHNHPTHSFRSRRITLNHIDTLEKSCVFGIA